MNAKPDNTKAASTQKPYSFEILRKPLPKLGVLICGQIGSNVETILIFISIIDL